MLGFGGLGVGVLGFVCWVVCFGRLVSSVEFWVLLRFGFGFFGFAFVFWVLGCWGLGLFGFVSWVFGVLSFVF